MKHVIYIFLIVILTGALAYQSLIAWDIRNVRKFAYANLGLHRDAAAMACVSKESVLKAAKQRDWAFEEERGRIFRSSSPEVYANAVRVYVEPPLNFVKEPGVLFFFDTDGCFIARY
mgnify:CR=1 FL=1